MDLKEYKKISLSKIRAGDIAGVVRDVFNRYKRAKEDVM